MESAAQSGLRTPRERLTIGSDAESAPAACNAGERDASVVAPLAAPPSDEERRMAEELKRAMFADVDGPLPGSMPDVDMPDVTMAWMEAFDGVAEIVDGGDCDTITDSDEPDTGTKAQVDSSEELHLSATNAASMAWMEAFDDLEGLPATQEAGER